MAHCTILTVALSSYGAISELAMSSVTLIQGGPSGHCVHISISTPVVPALKNYLCLELSRGSNELF
jgi:hypothetical protein